MAAEDEPIVCEFCQKGHIIKRMQELAFRQWSDKGYVYCRVTTLTSTCDHCPVTSWDPGTDKILEEAFQREYDKLP